MVFLLMCNDARLMHAANEAESPPAVLIGIFYAVAFLSLFALFQSRQPLVRMLFRILFFSVVYTDVIYLIIGNFPFSFPDAINLFNNPGYSSGALANFKFAFLLAFAGAGVVFTAVLRSVNQFRVPHAAPWVLVFVAIQAFLFHYSDAHPGADDFTPSLYRVTGNLLSAGFAEVEERWNREAVAAGPGPRQVQHLFIVVDESIEGSCLSVNGFPHSTTPYLQREAGQFINFGIASSFANYSAGSNLALFSGLRMDELPDRNYVSFRKPGVFQYAKKAGYQTFLMDGQSNGRLQNYMTPNDLPFIDSLFRPGAAERSGAMYERDSLLAEKIALVSASKVPTFAYVNKAGAHWPYKSSFPAWFADRQLRGPEGSLQGTEADYFTSIRWSVDRFWQQLATKLETRPDVLILYTSDHGENYAAGATKVTHASIYQPAKPEGQVPLLAFDHARFFPPGFSPGRNRYSHQAIFPTLLSAMGYDSSFIHLHYGRSLLDLPSPAARWFQAGDLFGRGKNQHIYL